MTELPFAFGVPTGRVDSLLSDKEIRELLVSDDLVQEYNEKARRIERDIKRNYQLEEPELRKRKIAGLESEQRHRDLLNLSVYPFTEQGLAGRDLGYKFYRGSPLHELGVPNFDFLVARLEPTEKPAVLIPGEAKSSIPSPESIVNEIEDSTEAFKDNIDYVLEKYLREPPEREFLLEPVVMVRSFDSSNMIASVVNAEANIRVWHGPLAGRQKLAWAPPPKNAPNHMNYSHRDSALRNLMKGGVQSMRRVFNVWPKTHTLVQMGILITASQAGEGTSRVVSRHRLSTFLRDDLFYLEETERENLMDRLIKLGVEIGFLKAEDEPDTYRLVARGVRPDRQEETLRKKWIDWKIEQDRQAEIDGRLNQLFEELKAEAEKQRRLEHF